MKEKRKKYERKEGRMRAWKDGRYEGMKEGREEDVSVRMQNERVND